MNRIDLKNMHSKELRDMRKMIREELDFRADVGSELENKEAWMSSTEWSAKVQEDIEAAAEKNQKEARERSYDYIEESSTNICLENYDDLNKSTAIKEAQELRQQQQDYPHIIKRMESMRDWNRNK